MTQTASPERFSVFALFRSSPWRETAKESLQQQRFERNSSPSWRAPGPRHTNQRPNKNRKEKTSRVSQNSNAKESSEPEDWPNKASSAKPPTLFKQPPLPCKAAFHHLLTS